MVSIMDLFQLLSPPVFFSFSLSSGDCRWRIRKKEEEGTHTHTRYTHKRAALNLLKAALSLFFFFFLFETPGSPVSTLFLFLLFSFSSSSSSSCYTRRQIPRAQSRHRDHPPPPIALTAIVYYYCSFFFFFFFSHQQLLFLFLDFSWVFLCVCYYTKSPNNTCVYYGGFLFSFFEKITEHHHLLCLYNQRIEPWLRTHTEWKNIKMVLSNTKQMAAIVTIHLLYVFFK